MGGLLLVVVDRVGELTHELGQLLHGRSDVLHVLALVVEVDEHLLAGLVLGTVGGRQVEEFVIHGDTEDEIVLLDGHAEVGEGLADGAEVGILLVVAGDGVGVGGIRHDAFSLNVSLN